MKKTALLFGLIIAFKSSVCFAIDFSKSYSDHHAAQEAIRKAPNGTFLTYHHPYAKMGADPMHGMIMKNARGEIEHRFITDHGNGNIEVHKGTDKYGGGGVSKHTTKEDYMKERGFQSHHQLSPKG